MTVELRPSSGTPADERRGRAESMARALRAVDVRAVVSASDNGLLIRVRNDQADTLRDLLAAPVDGSVLDELRELLRRMRDWCLDGEEPPAPDGTWTLIEAVNAALAAAPSPAPLDVLRSLPEWDALLDAIDNDGGSVEQYRRSVTGRASAFARRVRALAAADREEPTS